MDGLVRGVEVGGISAHAVTVVALALAGGAAALGPGLRALRLEPSRVLSRDG